MVKIIKPKLTIGDIIKHFRRWPKDAEVKIQAHDGKNVVNIPLESVIFFDEKNIVYFTNASNSNIKHPFTRVSREGQQTPFYGSIEQN